MKNLPKSIITKNLSKTIKYEFSKKSKHQKKMKNLKTLIKQEFVKNDEIRIIEKSTNVKKLRKIQ